MKEMEIKRCRVMGTREILGMIKGQQNGQYRESVKVTWWKLLTDHPISVRKSLESLHHRPWLLQESTTSLLAPQKTTGRDSSSQMISGGC